ncbi:MAG: OadG family protein [Lachnospiraceae bacterium]|nr:OadG family protein [Lachnospiraceae bacterium]
MLQNLVGYGEYSESITTMMERKYDVSVDTLSECTKAEREAIVEGLFDLQADGNGLLGAIESFQAAEEQIGGPAQVLGSTAVIDDDQIIVSVEMQGTKAKAVAEVVLTNDRFLVLESASLNKVNTMADSMSKAGMNTLLGMGSVFIVLILISLIISCFNVIPKIQAAFAPKAAETAPDNAAGIENAVAQITKQEEDESSDLELVAVIAAAIAASEGATSTDGFVVRSIKRRRAF